MCDRVVSGDLLGWYDGHARRLPWRIAPAESVQGVLPDPYHIWLSEVMLQQTTVAAVKSYFRSFTMRWPTVFDLAAAKDSDVMAAWAGLGYYARARNLLKCARIVSQNYEGRFPSERAELLALPGIGPYTAAAIAAIAFQRPETVVDGNVERVMARLFEVETPLPMAKPELTEIAASLTPMARAGDYAQAVMDLGATICTPKKPTCERCPISKYCLAMAHGKATQLPRRVAKTAKPVRFGHAYVAYRHDGAVLLEQRPDKGLLGGMLGWPGSDWSDMPAENPPMPGNWTQLNAEVRHTFTHFHLRLNVHWIKVEADMPDPNSGFFVSRSEFRPGDLPTVMRKVFDLAALHVAIV